MLCLNNRNLVKIRINSQNMFHVVEGTFGQTTSEMQSIRRNKYKVQQHVDSKKKHSHNNSQPFYQNRAMLVTQAVTQKKVPRTCPILHSRLATCCLRSPLSTKKNMARSSRTFLLYNTPSPDFTNFIPTCIFLINLFYSPLLFFIL